MSTKESRRFNSRLGFPTRRVKKKTVVSVKDITPTMLVIVTARPRPRYGVRVNEVDSNTRVIKIF